MRALRTTFAISALSAFLLSLLGLPTGATWYAPDPQYLDSGQLPVCAVVCTPYQVFRTDDIVSPLKVPADQPLTFRLYRYDDSQPEGHRFVELLTDTDTWSDPYELSDMLECQWEFEPETWVTKTDYAPSYTVTFDSTEPGSMGAKTVGWRVRDIGGWGQASEDRNDGPGPTLEDWDLQGQLQLDVVIENTPPSIPSVVFDEPFTTSSSLLHVRWSSEDPESGVYGYQYAVGTSAGADNVLSWRWASPMDATETTITGATLRSGDDYYVSVKAQNGVGVWSAAGSGQVPITMSGDGWSTDGSILTYDGNGGTGFVSLAYAVNPDDPLNPSGEYEFSYSVKVDAYRALGSEDWPSPWMELAANGLTNASDRFFGDCIWRKRRVRFRVDSESIAQVNFRSDAQSAAHTEIKDCLFRPVDSIPRDTTLGVPYTGYHFWCPPGGGVVDGWTATDGTGYNDADFQAWLNTTQNNDPDNHPLLLRVSVNLDEGMGDLFRDDSWEYQTAPPTPYHLPQYHNDPPLDGTYGWVTATGLGYNHDADPNRFGFTQTYTDNIEAFLDQCDSNNVKVIAILYWVWPDWWWDDVFRKNGNAVPMFRKTAFDRDGDDMTYKNVFYKYQPGVSQDHTTMLSNYLTAIDDWLTLFGSHPSVWGVDIMGEPHWMLGTWFATWDPNTYQPTSAAWHGLGQDAYDVEDYVTQSGWKCHKTHRLRDFLAQAYDVVKTWREANGKDIRVVCDIDGSSYTHPRNFIDMAHPWDTSNPTLVRKVCDVFGPHWYQSYIADELGQVQFDGNGSPRLHWTQMWSFDRLQPWGNPEEGGDEPGLPDPVTDWTAEKPIIITETNRYSQSTRPPYLYGDEAFELPDDGRAPFNTWWYTGYLSKGKPRHIESFIFWSGSGHRDMGHLVLGTPVDPPNFGWAYGWKRDPITDLYSLGCAGAAVRWYGTLP